MNKNEIAEEILKGLVDLEDSGDIVITNTNPELLAKRLSSTLVEKWAFEFLEVPPDVVVIDECFSIAKQNLCQIFDLKGSEAEMAMNNFIDLLSFNRSNREIADLLSHQGYEEIAFGAYFCCHIKMGEYYSREYLDWRKNVYAKRKGER